MSCSGLHVTTVSGGASLLQPPCAINPVCAIHAMGIRAVPALRYHPQCSPRDGSMLPKKKKKKVKHMLTNGGRSCF